MHDDLTSRSVDQSEASIAGVLTNERRASTNERPGGQVNGYTRLSPSIKHVMNFFIKHFDEIF